MKRKCSLHFKFNFTYIVLRQQLFFCLALLHKTQLMYSVTCVLNIFSSRFQWWTGSDAPLPPRSLPVIRQEFWTLNYIHNDIKSCRLSVSSLAILILLQTTLNTRTVLYWINHTIIIYITLSYTTPHSSHYRKLHHTILHYATLSYTTPHSPTLRHTLLHYSTFPYTTPHSPTLCHTLLHYSHSPTLRHTLLQLSNGK